LFTKIVVKEEPVEGAAVVTGRVSVVSGAAGVTFFGVTAVVVCESETVVVVPMHPAVIPAARRIRHPVKRIKALFFILVTC